MEILKIGEKTWQNTVICQIRQSDFTINVFYCTGIGKFSVKHNRLKPTSEMALSLTTATKYCHVALLLVSYA